MLGFNDTLQRINQNASKLSQRAPGGSGSYTSHESWQPTGDQQPAVEIAADAGTICRQVQIPESVALSAFTNSYRQSNVIR